MLGFSIFLLTTCGLVSIQGWRPLHKNSNLNTNMNSFRRYNNDNQNRNMNFLGHDDYRYRPPQPSSPYYNDEAAEGEASPSEQPAGEEADKVEPVDDGLANAVGQDVLQVLNRRGLRIPRSPNSRRNSNYNSNYNLNILGRGSGLGSPDQILQPDENALPSDSAASAMIGDSDRYTDPQYGGWKNRPMGKDYGGYEQGGRGDQMEVGMVRDVGPEMIPQSTDGVIFGGDTSPEVANAPAEQAVVGIPMWGDRNGNTNLNTNVNNFGASGYRRNLNANTNLNSFNSKRRGNPKIYRRYYGRGWPNVEPHFPPPYYGPIY